MVKSKQISRLLVTGGAGFIGCNFVRHILRMHPDYEVNVLDKLTYAGRLENLQDINDRITFIRGDVCDEEAVCKAMKNCQLVVNFAAETHVDRSIEDPGIFVKTNIFGTYTLLEEARKVGVERFVQIGTDEVYGSIEHGSFSEVDVLKPSSPYSASKASADLLALSYFSTFCLPVIVTRSSNNFGPCQHPE